MFWKSILLLVPLLASLGFASATASEDRDDLLATPLLLPITQDRAVQIEHRTMRSRRDFAGTQAALEGLVPAMDYTYRQQLEAGEVEAALASLQALPGLNRFSVPARDFGGLLRVVGQEGRQALQYELGNPLTATEMTRFELDVAVYAPVRVLLRTGEDGEVAFEYDRPRSTMGQFGNPDVDEVAEGLDRRLEEVLLRAGGWM
jgi:hypothetical protein